MSNTETQGIRIEAQARYEPDQSNPEDNRYMFSYRITVRNEGARGAKLISRHWIIINADGERQDVRGPGVVGKTPDLAPGHVFRYTSFCPLDTEWGTMEGTYQMRRENGEMFDAVIGRFYLTTTAPELADRE